MLKVRFRCVSTRFMSAVFMLGLRSVVKARTLEKALREGKLGLLSPPHRGWGGGPPKAVEG
ncbi:hypothetical protein GCM10007859_19850 [Brevundimonas denitrificans]|uniref:Uncharacterized protein n=1 Tax=Brevundimonas denitrificans TaxID=1443434 RepID=A0ABQ6BIV6_9CAUL|nr:hypothetical protein GCM10007859_19850 [Brevundimonas denitrificans]